MILNKNFGTALKIYMSDKGLKAYKVAEKMGVSPASFSDYYKSSYPRPETKQKILNALGITEDELFGIKSIDETSERLLEMERRYILLEEKYMKVSEELMTYKDKRIQELQEANH